MFSDFSSSELIGELMISFGIFTCSKLLDFILIINKVSCTVQ